MPAGEGAAGGGEGGHDRHLNTVLQANGVKGHGTV